MSLLCVDVWYMRAHVTNISSISLVTSWCYKKQWVLHVAEISKTVLFVV